MRIVHIAPNAPYNEGWSYQENLLPKYQKKLGHDVTLIITNTMHAGGSVVTTDCCNKILSDGVRLIRRSTKTLRGPDEVYLKEKLGKWSGAVRFITYKSDESISIHEKCDIAVVPTIGYEGTSLSLLEAMACKCAVICTNVGGMTNVVIDHYNGLMINPNSNQLFYAIEELIENAELRAALAEKGYETVSKAFSLDKWKNKWEMIINEIQNQTV